MKPTAILFDLDGTLTDSKEGIINCVLESLKGFGISADPAALTGFIGPPLTWSYPHFFGFTQEQTTEAMASFQARYATVGKFENQVYTGVPETLKALMSRGYRLGVATSKPEVFAREILEHFHLASFFETVHGAGMDENETKADVIRRALSRMGISPDEAVMIGDRRHDMLGAGEVGVPAVGALWGYGSEEELLTNGAYALAKTPQDLLNLFP